jgi:phosphoribosylamine--glycine ligase
LLDSDLLTVMQATTTGTLAETEVNWKNGHACCLIMASKGYPESYEKGFEMTIPQEVAPDVYVAGAKLEGDKLLTNGGRVLGITSVAESLEEAIKASYKKAEEIKFENAYYRTDIGKRALAAYGK